MTLLSFECGNGLHAPICSGHNCKCPCHRATDPIYIGPHEPRWAIHGKTPDGRYYEWECRFPGCRATATQPIDLPSFPSLKAHVLTSNSNTKPIPVMRVSPRERIKQWIIRLITLVGGELLTSK